MVSPTLLLLVGSFGVSLALNTWELPGAFVTAELDQDWMVFKKVYNRSYTSQNEEITRRLYWEDNLKFIREHNLKYDRGEVTYIVGENDFADMADDEFEKYYLRGLIKPEGEETTYPEDLTDEPDVYLPREIDWRTQGLVSSVKNQGKCGSCWAFSALGALEGQVKKFHGGSEIPDLSEQNLVDCAKGTYKNQGCNGGWMHNAYQYISDNKGIDSEFCYPYRAVDQTCRYFAECKVAKDSGYKKIHRSEKALKKALGHVGPIAIAMDVNHKGFWYYKDGIFYEPACKGKTPTHAMVAVGYGKRGGKYWIIKNSWGEAWGNKGYVNAARGRGDLCGIAQWAIYPTGV